MVPAGPRSQRNTTVTDQLHTGFKGNFTLFDQTWNWDAGFGYGHFSLDQITTGLPNLGTSVALSQDGRWLAEPP